MLGTLFARPVKSAVDNGIGQRGASAIDEQPVFQDHAADVLRVRFNQRPLGKPLLDDPS